MGITARIMAGDTWENATIMENAGVENCEGVALSTFFDENDADASEFVQGFKAYLNGDAEALKLNGNNDTVAAVSALGYDAYMAIIEALKNVSGDITGEAVRDALASVSFDGVTGSISFDENGDANNVWLTSRSCPTALSSSSARRRPTAPLPPLPDFLSA